MNLILVSIFQYVGMERTWMVIFAKNAKKESIYHTTTKKDRALALTVLQDIIHQFRALTGARHVQSDLTKAAMVNLLVTFVKPVNTAMLKLQHPALTAQKGTFNQNQVRTIASHVQSDLTKAAMVNLLVTFVNPVVTAMLKQQHLALAVQKGTSNQNQVKAIAFHVQSDFVRTKLVKRNVTYVKDKEL